MSAAKTRKDALRIAKEINHSESKMVYSGIRCPDCKATINTTNWLRGHRCECGQILRHPSPNQLHESPEVGPSKQAINLGFAMSYMGAKIESAYGSTISVIVGSSIGKVVEIRLTTVPPISEPYEIYGLSIISDNFKGLWYKISFLAPNCKMPLSESAEVDEVVIGDPSLAAKNVILLQRQYEKTRLMADIGCPFDIATVWQNTLVDTYSFAVRTSRKKVTPDDRVQYFWLRHDRILRRIKGEIAQ